MIPQLLLIYLCVRSSLAGYVSVQLPYANPAGINYVSGHGHYQAGLLAGPARYQYPYSFAQAGSVPPQGFQLVGSPSFYSYNLPAGSVSVAQHPFQTYGHAAVTPVVYGPTVQRPTVVAVAPQPVVPQPVHPVVTQYHTPAVQPVHVPTAPAVPVHVTPVPVHVTPVPVHVTPVTPVASVTPVVTTVTKTVTREEASVSSSTEAPLPVIKSRRYKVRRPAIQNQFYDIEERVIIRPVGSALVELEQPASRTETKVTTHTVQTQASNGGGHSGAGRGHTVSTTGTTYVTQKPQVIQTHTVYHQTPVQQTHTVYQQTPAPRINTVYHHQTPVPQTKVVYQQVPVQQQPVVPQTKVVYQQVPVQQPEPQTTTVYHQVPAKQPAVPQTKIVYQQVPVQQPEPQTNIVYHQVLAKQPVPQTNIVYQRVPVQQPEPQTNTAVYHQVTAKQPVPQTNIVYHQVTSKQPVVPQTNIVYHQVPVEQPVPQTNTAVYHQVPVQQTHTVYHQTPVQQTPVLAPHPVIIHASSAGHVVPHVQAPVYVNHVQPVYVPTTPIPVSTTVTTVKPPHHVTYPVVTTEAPTTIISSTTSTVVNDDYDDSVVVEARSGDHSSHAAASTEAPLKYSNPVATTRLRNSNDDKSVEDLPKRGDIAVSYATPEASHQSLTSREETVTENPTTTRSQLSVSASYKNVQINTRLNAEDRNQSQALVAEDQQQSQTRKAAFSETSVSSPRVVISSGLSAEQARSNQEQFIRLLSERDSIAEVSYGPNTDTSSSLINTYVRSRVLSATPAPAGAAESSKTVNIRRIIVSRPIETEQEIEVREQTFPTYTTRHHQQQVTSSSEQIPVYTTAKPPAFAHDDVN